MRRPVPIAAVLLALCAPSVSAGAEEHRVAPGEDWAGVLARAAPGDEIVLLPGVHRPASVAGVAGSPGAPIVIRSERPDTPATIGAGNFGLHLQRPLWVVIEDVTVEGAVQNGINIDDQDGSGTIGEPWEAHLVLRRVTVRRTGPVGNFDGIKLSGLRGVRLEECVVEGWGGSAVDMVGCHEVRVDRCTFRGMEGYSQSSGVQIKGGSRAVNVRGCRFEDAGMRAVNLGGSTGLEFFRPPVLEDAEPATRWEAEDVVVRDCVFVGGECAVAIVGARGGEIADCTIVGPERWPFRLLQETRDPRFAPARGATVTGCLIVAASLRTPVNVGDATEPGSWDWGPNLWWAPGLDGAGLRASLQGSVDPDQFVADPELDDGLRPADPRWREFGAHR
ncbi:MAG: right-handed parallel beta-helix repeat-containing protein [Phycisphaerales bacterium]|nr:right-handed parallel beta-helix repeat-containing protein [Phycisphaerales bacterium]